MACPMCDKDSDKTYRPFCSKRCADLDLGKWMTGSYVIQTSDDEDEDQLSEEGLAKEQITSATRH